MDIKKLVPLLFVTVILIVVIGIQPSSSAKSEIKIGSANGDYTNEFFSERDWESMTFCTQLWVNGEWRGWRDLDFDIYNTRGERLVHKSSMTNPFTGWADIIIRKNYLKTMRPGNYGLFVSYSGSQDGKWPPASTTAIIHHE